MEKEGSDGDGHIHVAGVREIADRPGVGTSASGLEPKEARASGLDSFEIVRIPADALARLAALEPDSTLYGLVDIDGRETPLPPHGLLVSKKLAEVLNVKVGDWVEMEVLTDKRPKRRVMIAATGAVILVDTDGKKLQVVTDWRRALRSGSMARVEGWRRRRCRGPAR